MTGRHRAPRSHRRLPVNWVLEVFIVGVICCTVAIACLNVMGAGII